DQHRGDRHRPGDRHDPDPPRLHQGHAGADLAGDHRPGVERPVRVLGARRVRAAARRQLPGLCHGGDEAGVGADGLGPARRHRRRRGPRGRPAPAAGADLADGHGPHREGGGVQPAHLGDRGARAGRRLPAHGDPRVGRHAQPVRHDVGQQRVRRHGRRRLAVDPQRPEEPPGDRRGLPQGL
ncbi:MAG: Ligand-binding SRPBCC domain protein family, partial [uncultured Blastococcus sp.]